MQDREKPEDAGPNVGNGSPDRVLAFSDGVFAIIITILVLDIQVPEDLGSQSLRSALDDVAPTLTAWVISFLITGMYWVWHRDVFSQVRAVNRDVVWLNLLFLLPVSLIPFAASLLGRYDRDPVALHVYGAVMIAVTLLRTLLFIYLARHPQLLHRPLSLKGRRLGSAVAIAPVAVYSLAIALANAAPVASLGLYALMPLAYFAGIGVLRSRWRGPADAADYS